MPLVSSLFSLAAVVVTATAEASPEAAACEQLRDLLAREVSILRSVQDAASASAAVNPLAEVLRSLAAMDRSHEAEKALWIYIDNTEGVKQPFVELLQRLTIEFTRLEDASFFGCAELGEQLAAQLAVPGGEEKGAAE